MCKNKINNRKRAVEAAEIIKALKTLGFIQRDISKASGISETQISHILSGVYGITRGTLMLLKQAENELNIRWKKSQKILKKSD